MERTQQFGLGGFVPLFYKCPCGAIFREDSAHGSRCSMSDWPFSSIATNIEIRKYRESERVTDMIAELSSEAYKIERTLSQPFAPLGDRYELRARLEEIQAICPMKPHTNMNPDDIDTDRCSICRTYLM